MQNDDGIDIELPTLTFRGDPTGLYENLAKAQAEFAPIPRMDEGQIGEKRKFKYAGYSAVMKCVRPALTKYGISILQPLHYADGMAVTTTILAGHGASISSSFRFRADFTKKFGAGTADDPQEFGRCHTYYRRYQLQSMLGVEGDADADDFPAVEPAQFTDTKPAPKAAEPKPAPKAAEEPKPAPKAAAAPEKPAEPAKVDTRSVNARIFDGMKQLQWGVDDLKAFFKAEVDKRGFDKADNLSVETKEKLYQAMVDKKGIAKF